MRNKRQSLDEFAEEQARDFAEELLGMMEHYQQTAVRQSRRQKQPINLGQLPGIPKKGKFNVRARRNMASRMLCQALKEALLILIQYSEEPEADAEMPVIILDAEVEFNE